MTNDVDPRGPGHVKIDQTEIESAATVIPHLDRFAAVASRRDLIAAAVQRFGQHEAESRVVVAEQNSRRGQNHGQITRKDLAREQLRRSIPAPTAENQLR